jgi:PTS system nitrogen regulatory IIA component
MYLNLIQIAESFGVSEKVVEDWIRNEGMPHVPDRGRLLFDRGQVVAWAAERGLAARVGFLAAETPVFAAGFGFEALIRAGGIWRDVPSAEVLTVFEKVVSGVPDLAAPVRRMLAGWVRAKDGINWAPVGGGFALPHLRARIALGHDRGAVAILLLRDALALAEPPPDGVPVSRLFFFVAPSPRAHLELLGRLSRGLTRGPLRELVVRGAPDLEILAAAAGVAAPGSTASEAKT